MGAGGGGQRQREDFIELRIRRPAPAALKEICPTCEGEREKVEEETLHFFLVFCNAAHHHKRLERRIAAPEGNPPGVKELK